MHSVIVLQWIIIVVNINRPVVWEWLVDSKEGYHDNACYKQNDDHPQQK